MRLAIGLFMVLALAAPVLAGGRPMTVDDLLAVKAVSDPHVSPDGQWIVYVVSALDPDSGASDSDLWLVPVDGGEPKQLTTARGTDNHPRWSPDGRTIAFVSDRGGSSQIWLLPVDGGEARPLTKLPIDVDGPIWSPRGDVIAFAAQVYPGTTPEETAKRDREKAEAKSKARTFDSLMIRHWTTWDEGKRSHLFVADVKTGEARDLTPDLKGNTPPAPFGDASDWAFAPDGEEIAFTVEPLSDHAWSTNTDVWTVPVVGGEATNMTADNLAADSQPSYSPAGRLLAHVSQSRAGFESDLWRLRVRDRAKGRVQEIAAGLDRPIRAYTWAKVPEADRLAGWMIYAALDQHGTQPIFSIEFHERTDGTFATREINRIAEGGSNHAPHAPHGGEVVVFTRTTADRPAELYSARSDGRGLTRLTHHNDDLVAALDLPEAEPFLFPGAGGDEVEGLLFRPPGFDESRKYPVLFLIHGGPQGAWHDEWHSRWNYALFAAPGYAVVAINPRGSTGYGQSFTDQISRDWTGKVFEDLMKGLDHALEEFPFLDGDRIAAAGGSYGGFMVNWICGQSDRFKALVSHAGVFDLPSMYFTTEELWFPEWEFGGPPWENLALYEAMSPSRFAQNFETPTLVLHGALDFRVPDAQGLGMFTALQRRGVPSRYVYFPDEGHWILKPDNRRVWWNEVHAWLAKYLAAPGGQ